MSATEKVDISRAFSRKTKRPPAGGLFYVPHEQRVEWLRGLDLNQRPLGYEPNELPGCSTPHFEFSNGRHGGQMRRPGLASRFSSIFLIFFFLNGALGVGEDFFGDRLRNNIVVVHFHVVTRLALGHGS